MTTSTLFTREQRLANECTHEQYYNQFLTPGIISHVESWFGVKKLKASKDEHFNDIPLRSWDSCGHSLLSGSYGLSAKMKEAGDFLTQAGLVCICKAAARQIVNS